MAKLGTNKRPAVARVRTMDAAEQIVALCQERGWKVIVGVEPDEPEDISDVEYLLGRPAGKPAAPRLAPRIGRNDYCPCRSGRKFKNCCGASQPRGGGSTQLSRPAR